MVGDAETRKGLERLEVRDRTESDHHPIIIWVRRKDRETGSRKRRKEGNGGEYGIRREEKRLLS